MSPSAGLSDKLGFVEHLSITIKEKYKLIENKKVIAIT